MKKGLIFGFLSILMITLIGGLVFIPNNNITVEATNNQEDKLVYVNLGDSIAEGYQPESITKYSPSAYSKDANGFNNNSYAQSFRNQLIATYGTQNVESYSYAVAGYTSKNLLDQLNNASGNQLATLQNADIITISIGANDILTPATNSMVDYLIWGDLKTITTDLANGVFEFAVNLPKINARLQEINPNAEIIYNSIYNPFKEFMYLQNGEDVEFMVDIGFMDLNISDFFQDTLNLPYGRVKASNMREIGSFAEIFIDHTSATSKSSSYYTSKHQEAFNNFITTNTYTSNQEFKNINSTFKNENGVNYYSSLNQILFSEINKHSNCYMIDVKAYFDAYYDANHKYDIVNEWLSNDLDIYLDKAGLNFNNILNNTSAIMDEIMIYVANAIDPHPSPSVGHSHIYNILSSFFENNFNSLWLDFNGGYSNSKTSNLTIESKSTLTKNQLPIPSKAGENSIFKGWFKQDGNKWNFETDIITCNTTLTAQWTDLKHTNGNLSQYNNNLSAVTFSIDSFNTPEWYVNDIKQEAQGQQFVLELNDSTPSIHNVYCVVDGVKSKVYEVEVLESVVNIVPSDLENNSSYKISHHIKDQSHVIIIIDIAGTSLLLVFTFIKRKFI